MIACIVFIFVTFFMSHKLRPYFGKFIFCKSTVSATIGAIVLLFLTHFLGMNFNFFGIFETRGHSIDVSKIIILCISFLMIIILGFFLDLVRIYCARCLDWLWEVVSDFFTRKK